jgi:glycosyltransferase involved in cell wall biosynthesis
MRICYTNFSDLNEPSTLNIFYLGEELAKLGHEITMLLPRQGIRYISHSKRVNLVYFDIISSPREAKVASQAIIQTLVALRQRFDIIHSVKPLIQSALPAITAGTFKNTIKVLYWDDYEAFGQHLSPKSNVFYNALIGGLEREFLKMFDGIICVSPFLAEIAKSFHPDSKVYLMQNGFSKELFSVRVSPERIKKKLNIKRSDKIVMYAGGLKHSEDIDLVIRAMPYVLEELPNTKLVISGRGPARDDLVRLSKEIGLSHSVIFTWVPFHEQVPELLSAADVLTIPLRDRIFNRARFPNRIPEYMAAGKPIVTNKVGVANIIFKDGYNAIVVDSEDPKEFAHGIIRALIDDEEARKIGERAREYAWDYLTWDKIAQGIESFYVALLKEG